MVLLGRRPKDEINLCCGASKPNHNDLCASTSAPRPRNSDPSPFTWQEFYREWECACVDAWEAGCQEPTVTLPLNVFYGVTHVVNPITGTTTEITRVSPFSWEKRRCACGNAQ